MWVEIYHPASSASWLETLCEKTESVWLPTLPQQGGSTFWLADTCRCCAWELLLSAILPPWCDNSAYGHCAWKLTRVSYLLVRAMRWLPILAYKHLGRLTVRMETIGYPTKQKDTSFLGAGHVQRLCLKIELVYHNGSSNSTLLLADRGLGTLCRRAEPDSYTSAVRQLFLLTLEF